MARSKKNASVEPAVENEAVKAAETEPKKEAAKTAEAANSDYRTEWVNNLYHKDRVISQRTEGEDGKKHLVDTVTPLTKGEDGKTHRTAEGEKPDYYNVRVPYNDGSGTKFANVNVNSISEKGESGKTYSAKITPNKDGNVSVKYSLKDAEGKYQDVRKDVPLDDFMKNVEEGKKDPGYQRDTQKNAVQEAMAKGEAASKSAEASKDVQAEA